jgi:hypothetical protein
MTRVEVVGLLMEYHAWLEATGRLVRDVPLYQREEKINRLNPPLEMGPPYPYRRKLEKMDPERLRLLLDSRSSQEL